MMVKIKSLPAYIYVGEYLEQGNWAWDRTRDNFEDTGSVYMGEMTVDDSEVTSNKFNL